MEKKRLSRWSRLKSKGGASPDEDNHAQQAAEQRLRSTSTSTANDEIVGDELSISGVFPENKYKRPAAPVMAPLAGSEDGDSDFEAPPEAALAMINGQMAHDPDPGANAMVPLENAVEEQERELTEEEAEYVSTLPAIDTLTNESDFTPFMSGKVPEFLRRKALRVLYQSHPILGFRDGLNDYDHDYNIIDTLIDAATQTSYKVGQGQEAAQEIEDPNEDSGETDESRSDDNIAAAPASEDPTTETQNPTKQNTEGGTQSQSVADNGDESSKSEGSDAEPLEGAKKPVVETKSIRDVRKPAARD